MRTIWASPAGIAENAACTLACVQAPSAPTMKTTAWAEPAPTASSSNAASRKKDRVTTGVMTGYLMAGFDRYRRGTPSAPRLLHRVENHAWIGVGLTRPTRSCARTVCVARVSAAHPGRGHIETWRNPGAAVGLTRATCAFEGAEGAGSPRSPVEAASGRCIIHRRAPDSSAPGAPCFLDQRMVRPLQVRRARIGPGARGAGAVAVARRRDRQPGAGLPEARSGGRDFAYDGR